MIPASVMRWLGPAGLMVVILLCWSLWIGPLLGDVVGDWAFLHAARQQAIAQQQQQIQKAAAAAQEGP